MSHNEGRPCSFSFTVLQKMQMLSHVTFYCRVTWLITPQGAPCAIIYWEMLLLETSTQSTPPVGHNSGSKSPKHYHCNPLLSREDICPVLLWTPVQCGEWDGDDGGWKWKTLLAMLRNWHGGTPDGSIGYFDCESPICLQPFQFIWYLNFPLETTPARFQS